MFYKYFPVEIAKCLYFFSFYDACKVKKNYFEITVQCSLRELIKRDTKGLYKLAKENKMKNLIGYKSKILYEKSKYKTLKINTHKLTKTNAIKNILKIIL